jgi:hypothetical protein
MKIIVVILIVLLSACSLGTKFSHHPEKVIQTMYLNGTVFYHFKNIHGAYYGSKIVFIDKNTQKQYFFEQNGHFTWAEECCLAAKEFITVYGEKDTHLFKGYQQYEDTTTSLYEGIGGRYYHSNAIYYTNPKEDIAVVFNIKGKGFLINKACQSFIADGQVGYNEARDCPFIISRKELFGLPFVSLAQLDSLYSLSESEQKQLGLIHVAENRFYIGFCD